MIVVKKKKIPLRPFLILLVLIAGFTLSLGLKPNEKIKAAYSNPCKTAGTYAGYVVDANLNVIIPAYNNAVFGDTFYDSTSKEIHCKSITIETGATLDISPKTTGASKTGGTNYRRLVLDGDLNIASGGTLNLYGGNIYNTGGLNGTGITNDGKGYGMNVMVGGNVLVESGGWISADGKGYEHSKGPGAGVAEPGSQGAAYGGAGPDGTNCYGKYYGSVSDPIELGSGSSLGVGGGVVDITAAGTILIRGVGKITANSIGEGSGGSVRLSANTISSTIDGVNIPSITANGGSGSYYSGGGRIALFYNSSNFGGDIKAIANAYGGAGTVFKKKNIEAYGDLIITNNYQDHTDNPPDYTPYAYTKIGKTKIDSGTYKNITVNKRANAIIESSNIVNINGGTFEVNNSKLENKGTLASQTSAEKFLAKNTARILNSGTGLFSLSANSNAIFDGIDTYFENQNNIIQNFANLTISNGAVMSHAVNDATGVTNCLRNSIDNPVGGAIPPCEYKDWGDGYGKHWNQKYTLRINATSVNIDNKSSIDVSQKGFQTLPGTSGFGPGGSSTAYSIGGYAGGSYGGRGGNDNTGGVSADIYGDSDGDLNNPNDLGSSGDTGYTAGGLVRITVLGDIVNNGSILSNSGTVSNGFAGGSGGGIRLDADRILGAGKISANGMPGTIDLAKGGGGGGRIAITYKTTKDFYGPITAYGGSTDGGPGTILFANNSSGALIDKELVISNSVLNDNPTKIGGGTYKNITVKNTSPTLTDLTLAAIVSGQSVVMQDGGNFEVNQTNLTNSGTISLLAGTSNLVIKGKSNFINIGPTASPGINANSTSKVILDNANFENKNNIEQNFGNLYIQNGAILTHTQNDYLTVNCVNTSCTNQDLGDGNGMHYNQAYTLRIHANNALIDKFSAINVDGKGYDMGRGPGNNGSANSAGSYGGAASSGDSTYGLADNPNDLGSGGYSGSYGDNTGGGLVRVRADGNITVDGFISSDTTSAGSFDGASGGGIKLIANSILGSGSISASSNLTSGNIGGGGRISLIATQKNYSGTVSVNRGGTGANYGTIYDSLAIPTTYGPSATPLTYNTKLSNNTPYIKADSSATTIGVDEGNAVSTGYTPDSDTSLLLKMDNWGDGLIYDSSAKSIPVIKYGTTSFSDTVLKTGTHSLLFNGSTGRLIPDGTFTSNFQYGTGAFTIDTWIYPKSVTTLQTIYSQKNSATPTTNASSLQITTTGQLKYTENGVSIISPVSTIKLGSDVGWQHVALVRDNLGVERLFYNGSVVGTQSSTYSKFSDVGIGCLYQSTNTLFYNGYMDEFRISKGVARWTSDFIPLSDDGNWEKLNLRATRTNPSSDTKLLLHLDGTNGSTTYTDSSPSNHTILRYNTPTISTNTSKFGGASGAFPRVTSPYFDYIYANDNVNDWTFGAGDFTIDFWANFSDNVRQGVLAIGSGAYAPIAFEVVSNNLNVYMTSNGSSWDIASGQPVGQTFGPVTPGVWVHYALTRNGNTFYLFVNGTTVNSFMSSLSLWNNSGALYIGQYFGSVTAFKGYLDEFRIIKGRAAWSNNFTPSTTPYEIYDDPSFNGTVDIGIIDNLAGEYVFSGCNGANCTFSDSKVTARFINGIANLAVKVKDKRDGQIKHHGFSGLKINSVSNVSYINNNQITGAIEIQDRTPERSIPSGPAPAGSITKGTAGATIFPMGAGFSIINNSKGTSQSQQDLGGNLVVRGPLASAPYRLYLDKNIMYKRGDYLNSDGTISSVATDYQVVCVNTADYTQTKIRCNDDLSTSAIPSGLRNYGIYTFNKTYNFYTQNETSNYSAPSISQVLIPASNPTVPVISPLTITPTNGKLNLSWNNPIDNIGQTKTLIVRGIDSIPTFVPSDGTDYNTWSNTTVTGEEMIYDSTNVGAGSEVKNFDDANVFFGTRYCYTIYAQYIGYIYSVGTSACSTLTSIIDPPVNPTITIQGMMINIGWTAPPSGNPDNYLIVRKKGTTEPNWNPTGETADYNIGDTVGDGVVVCKGFSCTDQNVNVNTLPTQYYYKIYAQYGTAAPFSYSVGSTAVSGNPNPENPQKFDNTNEATPSVTLDNLSGPYTPLNTFKIANYLVWKATTPADCSGAWTPTNGADYSGVQGTGNIIYKNPAAPISYIDTAVTNGVGYCYKIFVQYNGETINTTDLMYSSGLSLWTQPPNHNPTISVNSITQTIGTDNVVINFNVNDIDPSDNGKLSVGFAVTNPVSGCSISTLTGPITNLGVGAHSVTWTATTTNGTAGDCPGVEMLAGSAQLTATVSDFIGATGTASPTFSLDTKAPIASSSLILSSKNSNSITVATGATGATDGNIKTTAAYKVYYKQGSTVDEVSGTQILPNINSYVAGQIFTASSLITNQQYSFNIWAYDNYGHKTAATVLNVSTKGKSVTGFTAIVQGMRVHLSWDAMLPAPDKHLVIRKKGTSASTWTPTDGIGIYAAGNTVDADTIVVYHGTGVTLDDDAVDGAAYTYTIFANYSGNLYSEGVSAPSITPNALNASLSAPAYIPNGSNYDIALNWVAPTPSYSLQKYVVVREVGSPTCLIEWTPTKDNNYNALDPTGFTNEEIIYSGTGTTTTDNMGGTGVSSGTNVCYKIFTQYLGDDLAVPTNLVYSAGIAATYVPPNLPPEIEIGSVTALQTTGTENIVIAYRVRDSDSTNLNITFSMIDPGGSTCQMNLTDNLAGIDGTYYTHTATWNAGLAGECPGFEVTNAVIQVTASDSLNSVSQNSAPFLLDTLSPRLPTPTVSNFNLTNFSSTGDKIFFNLGSNSTTDTNALNYKIYYASGGSVDETGILITGAPIAFTPGAAYSVTGLTPGQNYTFNIWAYDKYGHKTSATSVTYSTIVPAPASFSVTPHGMRLSLTWTAPVGGTPDYYLIVRKANSDPIIAPANGSTYNLGDILSGGMVVYNSTGTSLDDDNIDDGPYYYRIYAHYSNGNFSPALAGNAIAVAEGPNTFSATSSPAPVVTYIDTPPTNNFSFENYLIWKKEQPSCTTDGNLVDGTVYNYLDSVDGGTIIYKSNIDPNGMSDISTTITGHTYCYKMFVEYNGETTNTIYSNEMYFQITPPNNPPTLSALSVVQTIGSDDVVIGFTINDPDGIDAGNLSVALSIVNPPEGCSIGTISGSLTGLSNGSYSVTWTDADTTCPGLELSNAGLEFIAHDLIDYSSAQISSFLLDTKAPTLIEGLTYDPPTADTIVVRLSTNTFFLNPLSVDQNLKGGGNSFKIYYKQDSTVSESDTQLAAFDNYILGQDYTATPLGSNSQYSFNIWAYDNYGHKTAYTDPVKPTTSGLNGPPVVQYVAQPVQAAGTGNINFSFEVKDPDSDGLTITFSLINNPVGCSISGVTGFTNPVSSTSTFATIISSWNAKLTCDGADQSDLKIRISADDGNGHTATIDSDPFTIDTKNPVSPGNLSFPAGTTFANQVSVKTNTISGSDTNADDWHVYRVDGNTFPTDPFSPALTPIKLYDPYIPDDVFIDSGLTPDSDYTYNICLHDTFMNFTCATSQTIHTPASILSFNILGIASGISVGVETTNITTTSTTIPFGSTTVGDTKVGALDLQGTTNLVNGYTIDIRQDQDLTSGGNTIPALTSTNASPQVWPPTPISSFFGYSSINLSRFSNGVNWAGLTLSDLPIVTQINGTHDDDVLFKLSTKSPQPAGTYQNTITFSIMANP
ncbi:MAG TPA: hypothetical protein P5096_03290 [Patescibacteria group bacterium]|nr:hypothetical protein [Patescibacteria group bacterium]